MYIEEYIALLGETEEYIESEYIGEECIRAEYIGAKYIALLGGERAACFPFITIQIGTTWRKPCWWKSCQIHQSQQYVQNCSDIHCGSSYHT